MQLLGVEHRLQQADRHRCILPGLLHSFDQLALIVDVWASAT
jgi:hypothetical protein